MSDEDEQVAVASTSQILQASNILDDFYAKSVNLGGELSSAEMQVFKLKTFQYLILKL